MNTIVMVMPRSQGGGEDSQNAQKVQEMIDQLLDENGLPEPLVFKEGNKCHTRL